MPEPTAGADDPRARFSRRVDDYSRFRPGYPAALINALLDGIDEPAALTVADIGAGTGIFTRLLLERGLGVYAVEPNAAMRAAAETSLASYAGFTSIDGAAEATGLAAASIDLVTAAQAFHWFNNAQALAEFSRILKPGGRLALIWNRRRLQDPLQRDYEAVLREFAPQYGRVNHLSLADEELGRCFAAGRMQQAVFDNHQQLDFDALLGRLRSASYCPDEDTPEYAALTAALQQLFAAHATAGRLRYNYDTHLYLGLPAR